jgi:hypothetical protein
MIVGWHDDEMVDVSVEKYSTAIAKLKFAIDDETYAGLLLLLQIFSRLTELKFKLRCVTIWWR